MNKDSMSQDKQNTLKKKMTDTPNRSNMGTHVEIIIQRMTNLIIIKVPAKPKRSVESEKSI